MYVCMCKAVTDGQIRKEVESGGVCTWKQLCRKTGIATQCGTCALTAKQIFDQSKAQKEEREEPCSSPQCS